jgi:hypothetical protein
MRVANAKRESDSAFMPARDVYHAWHTPRRVRFGRRSFVLASERRRWSRPEVIQVPRFMYIFRGGGYASSEKPSPTELQQHLAKWDAWSTELLRAGNAPVGQPLAHPPIGRTLRGRDKTVTDGPYAESKDLVSGTLVIEAASLDEASQLARGCPILEFSDGSVEVRPVFTTTTAPCPAGEASAES